MPLATLNDGRYSLGMIRDLPSWQIPPGGLYDSLNMVFDRPGIARQRMGTTALGSTANAHSTSLGFAYSQDATPIEELYGLNGKTAALSLISKTTGAITSLGSSGPTGVVGRPARHFGFLVFPIAASPQVTHGAVSVAGQTTSTTFASTAVSSINANDPQLVLSGGDTTTNIKVGAVVAMTFLDASLTQWLYWGRVVSVDTSVRFTVWPVPTVTGTAAIGALVTGPSRSSSAGGVCAASFQNRLLLGNTMNLGAVTPVRNDRRVIYSILPTETNGGNIGATFVDSGSWPRGNYFDVPGPDPIIALEPVTDNQLLILTGNQPVIFTGDLITQQVGVTSPTITFDESSILQPAGCLSDLSVARTPRGIVWAGVGGIYAYSGGNRIDDLTGSESTPRINTYWRNLSSDVATFVIHGAAYVRNHYVISGTSQGVAFALACNMTNLQWTRLSGAGTDNFLGVARPSNPSQVFAARWWDQTGAAPSMTNGQVVRLESILKPYTTGATTTDSDGAAVPIVGQTRTITGDAEIQKMFQRGVAEYQQSSTTPAVTVTAQSTIDAADVDASRTRTLGTLSNTATSTITNATNATPIVVTTSAAHGLQTDDFVDIDAVLGNLNANGQYRINVTGGTTFSLVGSTGSAAYTSGGKVKKRTEQTFQMSPLNKGQGASLSFTGSPNYFELHAVKLAVLQQEPVAP